MLCGRVNGPNVFEVKPKTKLELHSTFTLWLIGHPTVSKFKTKSESGIILETFPWIFITFRKYRDAFLPDLNQK